MEKNNKKKNTLNDEVLEIQSSSQPSNKKYTANLMVIIG